MTRPERCLQSPRGSKAKSSEVACEVSEHMGDKSPKCKPEVTGPEEHQGSDRREVDEVWGGTEETFPDKEERKPICLCCALGCV